MTITPKQLENRRKYVGGSDLAAILGLSPYKNAHSVWVEKVTGELEPIDNDAIALGNALEPGLCQLAANKIRLKVWNSNPFRVVKGTRIGVHMDGFVNGDDIGPDIPGPDVPIECKTAGLVSDFADTEEWGEPMTDEIPGQYLPQCHGLMMATGADHCWVSALVRGRGHVLYRVRADVEIHQMIIEQVEEFWDCVEKDVPPADSPPELEVMKRLRRVPQTVMMAPERIVEPLADMEEAKVQIKYWEERKKEANACVLEIMGHAEAALLDPEADPKKCVLTYMQQKRMGIDKQKLKEEYPDAFEACQKESRFRVLRLKAQPKKNPLEVNTTEERMRIGAPLPVDEETADAT